MTHATAPKAGRRNPSCFFYVQASLRERPQERRPFLAATGSPHFYHFVSLYTAMIPFCTATASPEALCPSEPAFSVAKVLPWKHTQVPLTLFEHNFPAAFPISNRPYLANAQYRNDKIPPKFLVCCFLLGNLWMHVKIRSLREKPEGFRREGK